MENNEIKQNVQNEQNVNVPEPQCLHKWNWGAFIFGWIWGIGTGVGYAFLTLIPYVNIVMAFVLGAKGSKWAWEKQKNEKTPDEFDDSQHKWAVAGGIYFLVVVVLSIIIAIAGN